MRVILLLLVTFALAVPVRAEAEPVRYSAEAFGTQVEIEVRDLPRDQAEAAARAALHEVFDLSQLFDPKGREPGSLGNLNAAAGGDELQVLEPRVAELLRRGLQFCLWTSGAHGPLGGKLYHLWNASAKEAMPDPTALRDAVISADCRQVVVDYSGAEARAALAAGSRLEAVGMGRGFAIDRAADILNQAGVTNAWLELGGVWRAMGPGPAGHGWLASLPPAPGSKEPFDKVWLKDQSLAIASVSAIGDEAKTLLIDQRTGVPARGVVMVATVTELAVDADALATILFITGLREGQMRLGGLDPRPSVLWLLGEGKGTPLESTYRWSELERVRRPSY